jgi:Ca-activated chloride channel family protein
LQNHSHNSPVVFGGPLMGFARPELLWLLTILVPLSIWTIRGRWRRRKRWQSLAQRGRPSRDGTPGIVGAIICLIIALAQPRWGNLPGSTLPPGHDLVLVIDVSRSMAAEDAVPNRLAMAVEMADSLVKPLGQDPANRAAVVAFAGRGVLRCPLTENLGAVRDALHRLQPGCVKPGGTDLGAALDAALEAFAADQQEHAQGRAIAIFSDGEDHADRWRSRIDRLRERDIVVHTVSIGDASSGHPVPADKSAEPLTFRGEKVLSKRTDTFLEAIANGTGGTIVKLGLASSDLGKLYESKIEPLARRQHEISRLAGKAERFPLFLLSAMVLLLLGCMPANRRWYWHWHWHWYLSWRGSLRSHRFARALGPVLLLVTMTVLAGGAADSQPRPTAESAESAVARGTDAYDDRRFDTALAAFQAAIDRAPDLAVPRYNAAATLFQLKQYARAREFYLEARQRAHAALRTKIDYALGNTALALGEIAAAIRAYDDCLASTAGGARLDQVRRDAAINRKFAVEQAESPAIADSENPDDPSRSPRRDGRRGSDPRENGDDNSPDSQADSGSGDAGTNPDGGDPEKSNRPPNRRRRTGGAGGAGRGPQGALGDSPDDRLDAALEHIRQAAESRRLPEESPPDSPANEGKDW